jgi:hypothetical protein
MIASTVLKCIMLAQFHVNVVEVPIDEYAMATMNKVHNGMQFEATVIEGKLNSIAIESLELPLKTMSYSSRDYQQRSLSTRLDFNGKQASMDCEIN